MTEPFPISKAVSIKFSNASFVCACMVVCQHLTYDRTMCDGWVFEMFFHGLPKVAVPFFFLTSGFFLHGKLLQSGGYVLEVKKRVRSLLVPYLSWNIIWMMFIGPMIWYSGSYLWPSMWQWFGLDLMSIPAFGQLWFMRNLMLLVIVSPILFCGVKVLRIWFVAIIFAIEFVFLLAGVENDFLLWTCRLSSIAYFSLGAFLRIHPIRINHSFCVGYISLLISMALVVFSRTSISSFFFVPLFMLGLWLVMPNRPLAEFLTSVTFPIYLIHPFVIKLWGSLFGRNRSEIVLLGLEYVLAIGFSVLVAHLLKKWRCAFSILFGGRG